MASILLPEARAAALQAVNLSAKHNKGKGVFIPKAKAPRILHTRGFRFWNENLFKREDAK